jgi:hypothetical protein
MRLVRILLVALAVVAVGLAGWALGARDPYTTPAAGDPPPATTAPATTAPAAEAAVTTPAPAPDDQAARDPAPPAADPADTTRPAPPRPRIIGFGSEPVYPQKAGVWQLPPGPGEAILITDAEHATKVEFLLTPARGDPDDLVVRLGTDTNGRDAYMAHWRYQDRLLSANLTVRATGPGGVTETVVGVHHPDPEQP